jgi:hypothetical protein
MLSWAPNHMTPYSSDEKFQKTIIWKILHNPSYGHPWTISNIILKKFIFKLNHIILKK